MVRHFFSRAQAAVQDGPTTPPKREREEWIRCGLAGFCSKKKKTTNRNPPGGLQKVVFAWFLVSNRWFVDVFGDLWSPK